MKHAYVPRTTNYTLNPGDELNDLRMSDKVRPLYDHVKQFIRDTVDPMSVEFYRAGEKKTNRWSFTDEQLAILQKAKDKAKEVGLWNFFLPDAETGEGLNNLDYAYIAAELGKSPLASETMNCSAPDTGNMEVLERVGTKAQKEKWLKPLLNGEIRSAYAMTEPNVASSDAKNISTTAKLVGDEWVINGEKYYISGAGDPRCKIMIVMVKTNPDAAPSKQQSQILVPMDAPGITIRPSATMYDGTFANIFYDNVRIPAENLVGEVNDGWKVLTGALAFERGLVGGGIVLKVAHAFEQLRAHVMAGEGDQSLAGEPIVRDRMATLASEIEIGRLLMMHCAELAAGGVTPPEYGAISKVFSGELMERFGEAALDILGMRAALSEQMPGAIDNGRFEQNLRHSLMWVISIGTNEIQRSLIAQRALGLPR